MDSPSAQSARGLVFDRAGRLVASVAQEILRRGDGGGAVSSGEADRRTGHRRVAGDAPPDGLGRRNSTKSQTKHGFRTTDVESILDATVVFAGRIVEPAHGESRYLLLGVTSSGRHDALVFTRRGDKLRPISCRAMRKNEKEAFDAAT